MSEEIPITYIADYIAKQHLLPEGPEMFQRESDADCILCVGQQEYYAHSGMLAARSPTFRIIFNNIIDDGFWEDDLDERSSFTPPSSAENAGTPGDIEQDVNFEKSKRFLLELTLPLIDPEGSRFDELLYWIYTDNSTRWQECFTAQNYNSILQNIAYLNLLNPKVLAICMAFEKTTDPTLGLIGLAEQLFCLQ